MPPIQHGLHGRLVGTASLRCWRGMLLAVWLIMAADAASPPPAIKASPPLTQSPGATPPPPAPMAKAAVPSRPPPPAAAAAAADNSARAAGPQTAAPAKGAAPQAALYDECADISVRATQLELADNADLVVTGTGCVQRGGVHGTRAAGKGAGGVEGMLALRRACA